MEVMMSSRLTPAQRYRKIARENILVYRTPPNEPWEPHFRSYLEKEWRQESLNLCQLEATNGSRHAIANARISLFIYAVGLATYGRLDVIPFMLRNIPTFGKMSRLAWLVWELLPLPEKLRNARDWEMVAKWVEEHCDELQWDQDAEKFRLKERPARMASPMKIAA